jgi:ribosomal protein L7Ae-like RNA K-turn-binding protein
MTRFVLTRLSVFEKRAREELPLKYAKLQRLMFGVKEISREIEKYKFVPNRPFPLKLVVVANNLQDPEFLSQIEMIRVECEMTKTPFINDVLSRNQIGKICGKSIRQAVVAVINSDGAQDEIAKIIELLNAR